MKTAKRKNGQNLANSTMVLDFKDSNEKKYSLRNFCDNAKRIGH
jgi:hypothetical protein